MQKLFYENLECPTLHYKTTVTSKQENDIQSQFNLLSVSSKTRCTPQDTDDTTNYKRKHVFTELHVIGFQCYQEELILLDVTNFQQLFTIRETRIKPVKYRILCPDARNMPAFFRSLQQQKNAILLNIDATQLHFKKRHVAFWDLMLENHQLTHSNEMLLYLWHSGSKPVTCCFLSFFFGIFYN